MRARSIGRTNRCRGGRPRDCAGRTRDGTAGFSGLVAEAGGAVVNVSVTEKAQKISGLQAKGMEMTRVAIFPPLPSAGAGS